MRFIAEGVTIVVGVLAIASYVGVNIRKYIRLHREAQKNPPAGGEEQ